MEGVPLSGLRSHQSEAQATRRLRWAVSLRARGCSGGRARVFPHRPQSEIRVSAVDPLTQRGAGAPSQGAQPAHVQAFLESAVGPARVEAKDALVSDRVLYGVRKLQY